MDFLRDGAAKDIVRRAGIFVLLLAAAASAAPPETEILTRRTASVDPCRDEPGCSAREFSITVEDYRVWIDRSYTYGTRMFARYRTDWTGDLERYVLVQFMKGCQFYSYDNRRSKSKIVVQQGDQFVPYLMRDWVVDSSDSDPAYVSDESLPRHALYRSNDVFGSFEEETEHFVMDKGASFPELYVTDRPGTAARYPDFPFARNIAVQFRMCLFRAADVPSQLPVLRPESLPEPLACHDWQSSFVFDHRAGVFRSPKDIDGVCRAEAWR